jgi:hypothetical protein
VLEGIAASIGSIGDAYDNALAETIGLFKTEAIARTPRFGPARSAPAGVEYRHEYEKNASAISMIILQTCR